MILNDGWIWIGYPIICSKIRLIFYTHLSRVPVPPYTTSTFVSWVVGFRLHRVYMNIRTRSILYNAVF
jgi:hypothetical protein